MITFDVDNVRSVYAGRPGCACGCSGKHTYPERHREDWKELRGWGPFKDEDISDREVRRVTHLMASIANGKRPGRIALIQPNFIAADNAAGTRTWTLYWDRPNWDLVEHYIDLWYATPGKPLTDEERPYILALIKRFRAEDEVKHEHSTPDQSPDRVASA